MKGVIYTSCIACMQNRLSLTTECSTADKLLTCLAVPDAGLKTESGRLLAADPQARLATAVSNLRGTAPQHVSC